MRNEDEPWYEIQRFISLVEYCVMGVITHSTLRNVMALEAMHDDEACSRPIRPTRDRE